MNKLFWSLDEHEVRYCVLDQYEGLPEHLPSDLDLAVHQNDATKLREIFNSLAEEGYRPLQCMSYAVGAGYFIFGWFEGCRLNSVAVDVICEHRRCGLSLASGERLVAGRRGRGQFWIPDPAIELSYLLAKKTLKKNLPAGQAERLKVLVDELGTAKAEQIAAGLFGRKWAKQVIMACVAGSLASLLTVLCRKLWWTQVTRNPLRSIRCRLEDTARLIHRWRNCTGLFLVVLGPDGAGKSATLDGLLPQIAEAFRRHRRFHWRPGVLWKREISAPITSPHGQPPNRQCWSAARALAHILDYWVGYWFVIRPLLAGSGLVVFDRYYDDVLADPKRYRYGGPIWLVRALCRIRPAPELVLFLDASEEMILSRKQEVSEDEIRRQREAYLRLANESLPGRVINAGQPRTQMVAEATRAVADYLACRFRERQAHLLCMGGG